MRPDGSATDGDVSGTVVATDATELDGTDTVGADVAGLAERSVVGGLESATSTPIEDSRPIDVDSSKLVHDAAANIQSANRAIRSYRRRS